MLIGTADLAGTLRTQRLTAATSSALDRASQELSTGIRSNLVEASGGDLRPLFEIDRTLARLDVQAQGLSTAAARATASQAALGAIQDDLEGVSTELLGATERGDLTAARSVAAKAPAVFEATMARLNLTWGGDALFAGAALDGAAVADVASVRGDIDGLLAAAPDATAAAAAIEGYFAPGGGYDARFLGDAGDAPGVGAPDGTTIEYAARADDTAIRDSLAGLALLDGLARGAWPGSDVGALSLHASAATGLLSATDALIERRATLGVAEEQIASAEAEVANERTALGLARNGIAAADPFQTAVELESLRTQLDSLFTVTARLSGLSLTGYLR